jgi:hypothetical protein
VWGPGAPHTYRLYCLYCCVTAYCLLLLANDLERFALVGSNAFLT